MRRAMTGGALLVALVGLGAGLSDRSGGTSVSPTATVLAAGDYYVIGEYECVSVSDSSDSRGSCQIETHATESCQAAMESHRREVASRGDVCQHCVAGVTDNTRRFSGVHRFKQGGPCQGWQ